MEIIIYTFTSNILKIFLNIKVWLHKLLMPRKYKNFTNKIAIISKERNKTSVKI